MVPGLCHHRPGTVKHWLWTIGGVEDNRCECGVQFLCCSLVGDGRGKMLEETERDPEWYREMVIVGGSWDFL